MNPSDTELQLLETIYSKQGDSATLSQRDLAGAAGLSLGMTNALIRRFVERGWIKLTHLSGRSLKYILTSEGMEEVLRRSISYFSRAVRSASLYRDKIDAYVRGQAKVGFTAVVLDGPAELDFLFDYSCERHGLEFVKNPVEARRKDLMALPTAIFVHTMSFDHLEEGCIEFETSDPNGNLETAKSRASHIQLVDILFSCTGGLPDKENVAE